MFTSPLFMNEFQKRIADLLIIAYISFILIYFISNLVAYFKRSASLTILQFPPFHLVHLRKNSQEIIASGREVNVNIKDNRRVTAIEVVRKRGNEEKRNWEGEEEFQKRKRDCSKIIELLESFERDSIETRFKLRLKLELAGKIQFHLVIYFSLLCI